MSIDYMSQVSAISILTERLKNLIPLGYDFTTYQKTLEKIYVLTNQMLDRSYPEDGEIEPSALKIAAFFGFNLVEYCPIVVSMIPQDSVFNSDTYKINGIVDFKLVTEEVVPYIGFLVICDICTIANKKYEFNRHADLKLDLSTPSFQKLLIYTNPGFQRDFVQLLKVGALNPQAIVMSFSGLMEGLHGYRKDDVQTGW